MRCSYCHRPLRLLDRRHPQRLLLPRCRVCRGHTFGAVHKILLLLLCALLAFILMDLRMPVMTGVEATRLIREQSDTCRVPIVAMSAHCEGRWREEALAAGAIDCFSKLIEFGLLDDILGRYAA